MLGSLWLTLLCLYIHSFARNVQSPAHLLTPRIDNGNKVNEVSSQYLVFPKNGSDEDLLDRLMTTLNSTSTSEVYYFGQGDQLAWFYVGITGSQATKLGHNTDVDHVVENQPVVMEQEFSAEKGLANDVDFRTRQLNLTKRDQEWSYQDDAVDELVVISAPKSDDWDCRTRYYYPEEAGSGIYIYHIEVGLLPGYDEEFENRVEPALKTATYRKLDSRQNEFPDPPNGHSTCVADKAMGKLYGSAKKARLVPVLKGRAHAAQVAEAFSDVVLNIREDKAKGDKSSRYKRSIVVMSRSVGSIARLSKRDEFSEEMKREPWKTMKNKISELFDLGVPVVLSAGNNGGEVNTLPKYFFDPVDFPLINVGNADADGEIYSTSARGSKVAIFTDGVDNTCVGSSTKRSGTSYAAGLLAGGIAVFMSQTKGAFYKATKDKVGTRDFVLAVLRFLQQEASYDSEDGVRMFWNLNTI